MPDNENQTLNGDGINAIVGAPSASEATENLNESAERASLNTVDDPAVSSKADDKGPEGSEKGKDVQKGDEDKLTRFDQHPDWQRMKSERDEATRKIADLSAQVELLSKQIILGKGEKAGSEEGDTGKEKPLPFKDITQMDPEELREWSIDDPKGYAANLYAQVKHELMEEMKSKQETEKVKSSTEQTLASFKEAHPDFVEMWGKDGGKILDYMNQNPGHNPMSAYLAMTEESRVKAAVEDAVAKAKAEFDANVRAKRDAGNVLGTGRPASGGGDSETELKDTKTHGGLLSVLTRRHLGRRSASG